MLDRFYVWLESLPVRQHIRIRKRLPTFFLIGRLRKIGKTLAKPVAPGVGQIALEDCLITRSESVINLGGYTTHHGCQTVRERPTRRELRQIVAGDHLIDTYLHEKWTCSPFFPGDRW